MKTIILFFVYWLPIVSLSAQCVIEIDSERVELGKTGYIERIVSKETGDTVLFRNDRWRGPAFEGVDLEYRGNWCYEAEKEGLLYRLQYGEQAGNIFVEASIRNISDRVILPEHLRLRLGIDTYMDKFPDWNFRYFPTLLRTERNYFWGYFMSPSGKIMALASTGAVASWAYEYEQYPQKFQGQTGYFGEHRIFTVSLDLLHRLPLPDRYPQHLYALTPGQEYKMRLFFLPVDSLHQVKPRVASLTGAPLLEAVWYTLEEGKAFEGKIYTKEHFNMEVTSPRNEVFTVLPQECGEGEYSWRFLPVSGVGIYTARLYARNGKISESKLYVRPALDVYLSGARREGLRSLPTATHHAECFYPFYTYFLARRYLPDEVADRQTEQVFDSLYPLLYDDRTGEMRNGKFRIQDAATMAGVLADRYRVTGNENDLRDASRLADFLIRCQKEDGAYYNPAHQVHYTSVIYLAKSMMEVMTEEKRLAEKDKAWKKIYENHLKSVRAAMDDLARKKDDIQTEGQMTFEDGMISCSVAQLAMAALKEKDGKRKELYTAVARELEQKHRCLTQLLQPDCRMNGATLRFWEFQYTINLLSNGMNSPCGWSAWNVYGCWYLYLLTGEYEYLRQAFNGLGSCLQLYEPKSKELRFGFIPDPYIDALQYMEIPQGSGKPVVQRVQIGEQYLSQTSNWHKHPQATWRKKWGIDNFVHEVFKCMTEVALTHAYIIEHEDGSLEGINCSVERQGHLIRVTTPESLVKRLHVNLRNRYDVEALFTGGAVYKKVTGIRWLGSVPEELSVF